MPLGCMTGLDARWVDNHPARGVEGLFAHAWQFVDIALDLRACRKVKARGRSGSKRTNVPWTLLAVHKVWQKFDTSARHVADRSTESRMVSATLNGMCAGSDAGGAQGFAGLRR